MSLLSSLVRTIGRVPVARTQFAALFSTSPEWKDKLDKMVSSNKVVVFMKGVPNAPRCGFSNAVTQVSFKCSSNLNYFEIISLTFHVLFL